MPSKPRSPDSATHSSRTGTTCALNHARTSVSEWTGAGISERTRALAARAPAAAAASSAPPRPILTSTPPMLPHERPWEGARSANRWVRHLGVPCRSRGGPALHPGPGTPRKCHDTLPCDLAEAHPRAPALTTHPARARSRVPRATSDTRRQSDPAPGSGQEDPQASQPARIKLHRYARQPLAASLPPLRPAARPA